MKFILLPIIVLLVEVFIQEVFDYYTNKQLEREFEIEKRRYYERH